jgi:hypothetical protein
VKLAKAMGAHVVVFTTSENKRQDALRLGADEVILSRNKEEMEKSAGTFEFILDCVAADHDINAYLNLLTLNGNLTLVGAPEKPVSVGAFALIFGNKTLSGSAIGGIAETQEMLDFCGKHNITSDVEVTQSSKSTRPMSEYLTCTPYAFGNQHRREVEGLLDAMAGEELDFLCAPKLNPRPRVAVDGSLSLQEYKGIPLVCTTSTLEDLFLYLSASAAD